MTSRYCLGCMSELPEGTESCPQCGYIQTTPPKEAYHLAPGTILQGRYLVGRVLGFGGFGVTYMGMDLVLEQKVAIKEYLPTDFSTRMPGQAALTVYTGENDSQFHAGLTRFLEEARRLAQYENVPGVVQVKDTFAENNTAYIVMEFLDGQNVKDVLKEKGRLPYEQTLEIIVAVLSTLTEVHKGGIIHRDISPDNIFLTKDGQVKLLDFGAARYATTYHSKSLSVILKPGYAPEEQYRSRGEQGPWSDVYATAATMYKMLTGITPEEALERLARDDVKEPGKLGVKINQNAENALMNALNIKAEDRYQTAQEFLDALLSADPVLRNKIRNKRQDVGKWPWWLKMTAVLAVLAVMAFPALVLTGVLEADPRAWFSALPEGMVNVPGVINQTSEAALDQIAGKDLIMQITGKQYSTQTAADVVMLQEPQSGRLAAVGDIVNVIVSAGEEQVSVPEVQFFTYEAAVLMLEDAGLLVKKTEVDDPDYAKGTVTEQSLKADTLCPRGSLVELTVARGAPPAGGGTGAMQTVPILVGMPFEQAYTIARGLNLYVIKTEYAYDADAPAGTVLLQIPGDGTEVAEGTVITVTVNRDGTAVRVPNVLYERREYAVAVLESLGLQVTVEEERNEKVAKGLVIAQSLEANTQVKAGSAIKLVVSLGDEQPVPDMTGKTTEEAKRLLEADGFVFYKNEQYSETVEKGAVITQVPAGGSTAARGSAVTVIVSKGKDPSARQVEVPSLLGQTRAEAQAALLKLELVPIFEEAYSDTVAKGLVCAQQPAGGSVTRGSNVTVTVSLGSDKTDVPNVVGMDESSAAYAIGAAGLTYGGSSRQYSETVPRGRVISQSAAGRIQMGGSVTVTVSRGTADSGWLDGNGAGVDRSQYDVQTRTVYSTRVKETTTTQDAGLQSAGWTLVNTAQEWGPWQESDMEIPVSDTCEGHWEKRSKFIFFYEHWINEDGIYDWVGYGEPAYHRTGYFDQELPAIGVTADGHTIYGGYPCPQCGVSDIWFCPCAIESFDSVFVYRRKAITYTYERWTPWSDYTETPASANENTEVQTKTQYRYSGK